MTVSIEVCTCDLRQVHMHTSTMIVYRAHQMHSCAHTESTILLYKAFCMGEIKGKRVLYFP